MTPTKIFKKLLGIFLVFTFLLTDALPILNLTKTVFGADTGNAGGSGGVRGKA